MQKELQSRLLSCDSCWREGVVWIEFKLREGGKSSCRGGIC